MVNGRFPGPLIRLNRGDRLLVNVTNNLSEPSSLHWHGIRQNGSNWMDGAPGISQCPVPPGRSFLYDFIVDGQYGTYMYYSHRGVQRNDASFGPIIVHSTEEAEFQQKYGYTQDQVIVLQDHYHRMSEDYLAKYLAPNNKNVEPVPDNGLFQGRGPFDCSRYLAVPKARRNIECQGSAPAKIAVRPGQKHRMRLINTGTIATFQFAVDNHTFTVIEGDDTMVQPFSPNVLRITPGQRYSFLLDANQKPSQFWMRAKMDISCFRDRNPLLDGEIKAVLAYEWDDNAGYTSLVSLPGQESRSQEIPLDLLCRDMNTSLLAPVIAAKPPVASRLFHLELAYHIGAHSLSRAFLNGTTWSESRVPTLNHVLPHLRGVHIMGNVTKGDAPAFGLKDQNILVIPDDARVVDLLVQNFDDGAHPFHLHGFTFFVLATSSDLYFPYRDYQQGAFEPANPMRRDTINVNGYGWTLIRIIADNPGLWAFHCQVSWHMASGLLMQVQVRSNVMKDFEIPKAVLDLCQK